MALAVEKDLKSPTLKLLSFDHNNILHSVSGDEKNVFLINNPIYCKMLQIFGQGIFNFLTTNSL